MQPPKIDKRNYNEIIKDISQKLPYYAPLLKFDEAQKDPTGALIKIFAGMFEGTLKNLNRVPEKNYLAFLNMLGTKLLPSEPSRVPLTFRISEGAKNPVFIRKGAKVAANPQDGGSPVIFETEKGILAVPSKLQSAFYASKEKDFIAQVPQELLTGDVSCAKSGKSAVIFDFSDEKNLQSHVFYIGDRELFNFCKPVTFKITFPVFAERLYKVVGAQASEKSPVKWYYYAGEAEDKSPLWKDFDSFTVGKNEDFISLQKNNTDEIKLFKINGVESRWIKCEIEAGNADYFTGVMINPKNIRGEWVLTEKESGKTIMEPDKAFYNSIPLSLGKGKSTYPFSQTPRTNDIFYLSCNEALDIRDGELTLSFELGFSTMLPTGDKKPYAITASLSWEYWNGKSWAKLNIEKENNLDNASNKTIKFKCPKDIEYTSVNGEKGLWIRARILSGDYGRDVVVKSGDVYSVEPKYKVPFLSNIAIITSKTKTKQIDDFITYNNLSFYRYNRICDKDSQAVEIVSTPENDNPAFYLSFDKAFEKGPVSIFFSIGDRAYTKEDMPRMRWEYYSGTGVWKNMEVSDDGTQSLTRTGALVFSMPPDFASSVCFGWKLYWIRAVELNGRYTNTVKSVITPVLKGVYLNTAWASQSETVEDEFFSSSGTHNQQFTLSKTSVTYHEIWINEFNSLTEADRLELTQSGNFKTNEVKDSFGEIKEFWVKWQPVSDILLSMPADRCYEADAAFGLIRFGDGENGAVPPIGINNIRSFYRAGGGSRGNLETGEIKSMNSSISFVEGVFNPEPSKGGFEMETTGQMLKRASKEIRNRGKALTLTDFEELAYEASRSIARVKCLPNINDKGDCETGWVTLVVLPQSADGMPMCSSELIRRIEGYVSSRTSSNIAFPGKFRVINPDYIEISVTADVKVTDIELIIDVEKEILTRLSNFLNPIRGGSRGEGWDFGRMPYFSDFYALLERIPGVDYVEELSLLITDPGRNNPVLVDRTRILDLEKYSLKQHALVSNGKHSITLKI